MEQIISLEWQEWLVLACVAIMVFGIGYIDKLGDALGDGVDTVTKALSNNGKDDSAQGG